MVISLISILILIPLFVSQSLLGSVPQQAQTWRKTGHGAATTNYRQIHHKPIKEIKKHLTMTREMLKCHNLKQLIFFTSYQVDESELQDEPLQLRLMDHDTYSANDAIGKVVISLAPLLAREANNVNGTTPPGGKTVLVIVDNYT